MDDRGARDSAPSPDSGDSRASERTRRETASWNDLRWAVEAAERIATSEPPPARPVRGGTLRWGDRVSQPGPSPVRAGTLSWDDLVDLARAKLFELEGARASEPDAGDDHVPSTNRATFPDVAWEHDEPLVEIHTKRGARPPVEEPLCGPRQEKKRRGR